MIVCLQASLNFEDPQIKALIAGLPQAPALARRECLARCGLNDDDDSGDFSYSYDYDYDYTSDEGKRNLRG